MSDFAQRILGTLLALAIVGLACVPAYNSHLHTKKLMAECLADGKKEYQCQRLVR
jgi:hypothetical protein